MEGEAQTQQVRCEERLLLSSFLLLCHPFDVGKTLTHSFLSGSLSIGWYWVE